VTRNDHLVGKRR